MIKRFCDRCGKEILKDVDFFKLTINRMVINNGCKCIVANQGEKKYENEMEVCENCMNIIRGDNLK